MSSSMGRMTFHIWWKIKHVPNHQPVFDVSNFPVFHVLLGGFKRSHMYCRSLVGKSSAKFDHQTALIHLLYIYIYLHHWALTWNIANTDSDFLASVCQNSPMFGKWSFDPLGEIQCFLSNSQLLLESNWFKNHMKTTALGELQILCWSPNGSTRHFSQPSSHPPAPCCAGPRRQGVEPGVRRQQPAAGHGRDADAGEARVAAEQEPFGWRKEAKNWDS